MLGVTSKLSDIRASNHDAADNGEWFQQKGLDGASAENQSNVKELDVTPGAPSCQTSRTDRR